LRPVPLYEYRIPPQNKDRPMTRRLLGALRSIIAEPSPDAAVHFHGDGINGEPAECFDAHCRRPTLEV